MLQALGAEESYGKHAVSEDSEETAQLYSIRVFNVTCGLQCNGDNESVHACVPLGCSYLLK